MGSVTSIERFTRCPESMRREFEPRLRPASGLEIDLRTRSVSLDGEVVVLEPAEFALLGRLAREPQRAFTKAELCFALVHQGEHSEALGVDRHASRLRRKLGGRFVHNAWGVAYSLLEPAPGDGGGVVAA